MWSDKKLQRDMRSKQMSPDKWITVPEAIKRLGLTDSAVRRHYDFLEATKAGPRWLVLASKVEFLRKRRAGLIDPPTPPVKPIRPIGPIRPIWTPGEKTGIEITGKSWADWDTGEIWVPAAQAAQVLGLTAVRIGQMASKGKLRRRWSNHSGNEVNPQSAIRNPKSLRAMYCLTDLDAMAKVREDRKIRRGPRWNDPERSTPPPQYRTFDDIGPNDTLVNIEEAACMLGVSRQTVAAHIRRGQLFFWQEQPGKQGCPVFLSSTQIMRYRDDPRRLRAREWQRQARERKLRNEDPPKKYNEFKEDHDLVYDMGRSLKRSHGEYYSTRQAAEVLGISTRAVLAKRLQGVLTGHHLGRRAQQKFNQKRHWFFKIEDVHNLKANPDHRKRRAAYIAHKHRQLFGEDTDTPKFNASTPNAQRPTPERPTPERPTPKARRPKPRPPIENIPEWVKDAERGPVTPGEDRYIPHDPRNVVFLKTELQRWREETYAYLRELEDMESDPRSKGYYPGHYFNEGHRRVDGPEHGC